MRKNHCETCYYSDRDIKHYPCSECYMADKYIESPISMFNGKKEYYNGCENCLYGDNAGAQLPCCECNANHTSFPPKHKPLGSEIENPKHYNSGTLGIETIQAIQNALTPEMYRGYLTGNILKYVHRYRLKGEAITDLQKAKQYTEMLIKQMQKECD